MMRMVWTVVATAGVGLAAGCSDAKGTRPIGDEHRAGLQELGEMLKSLAEDGKTPPAKPADLAAVEPMIPVAGPAIRNGDLVYLWGARYVAGGTDVVAYEKQAPDEGGLVLFQDGTVKELTSAEFQSARKATAVKG